MPNNFNFLSFFLISHFAFNVIQVQGLSSSSQPRMSNILDKMTSSRKSVPLSSSSGKPNRGPVLKPLAPRPKTKVSSLQNTETSSLKTRLVSFRDTKNDDVGGGQFHMHFSFQNKSQRLPSLFCSAINIVKNIAQDGKYRDIR